MRVRPPGGRRRYLRNMSRTWGPLRGRRIKWKFARNDKITEKLNEGKSKHARRENDAAKRGGKVAADRGDSRAKKIFENTEPKVY
jgi:hypothetical protein